LVARPEAATAGAASIAEGSKPGHNARRTTTMALDEKQKERLAHLEREADERATEDASEAEVRKLDAAELTASLVAKGMKPRHDFIVVNNRFGVFAVRQPDTKAIRVWEKADDKTKLQLEWQIGVLKHYIEPVDKALLWAQTCATRPGLCWATSNAFVELMGVDVDAVQKK
jgi:hypothetical protein